MAQPGASRALRRFKRVLASAALLLSASAGSAPILMQPLPGATYTQGRYYLIPQPYAAVKADLEQGLAGRDLGGFQGRDDSGPLSSMEFYWPEIGARHLPALKQALDQQASQAADPVLAKALAGGVITRDEQDAFRAAIARQPDHSPENIRALPFFSTPVARWSFQRERGKSSRTQADYGTVMDLSGLTGRDALTLVWYGGTATTVTRHFRLTRCMVGVTCFPDPHIEYNSDSVEHADAALARYLDGLAQRLRALPENDADHLMQAYFDAYARGRATAPEAPAPAAASLPETAVSGIRLPADESDLRRYDNDGWRLLALPDGSLLASGAATQRFVPRMAAADAAARPGVKAVTAIEREATAGFGLAHALKIGADGQVWALGFRDDGSRTLLAWRPGQRGAVSHALSPRLPDRQIDDWTLPAAGGVALRLGDMLYAMTPQGRWREQHWDASLRRDASDTLEQALPWVPSETIAFGDGLFWAADRDGYGIDPATARVAASIRTATPKLVFGSRRGDWAVAIAETPEGRRLRAIDLRTGNARFDLETPAVYYTSAAARSAHGRLLALSGADNTVVVVDMAQGRLLANLRAPKEYSVSALAFSWAGDRLWIYARPVGNNDVAQLIAWNAPADAIDPAQGRDLPDQIRCGYSMACR